MKSKTENYHPCISEAIAIDILSYSCSLKFPNCDHTRVELLSLLLCLKIFILGILLYSDHQVWHARGFVNDRRWCCIRHSPLPCWMQGWGFYCGPVCEMKILAITGVMSRKTLIIHCIVLPDSVKCTIIYLAIHFPVILDLGCFHYCRLDKLYRAGSQII